MFKRAQTFIWICFILVMPLPYEIHYSTYIERLSDEDTEEDSEDTEDTEGKHFITFYKSWYWIKIIRF